MNFDDFEQQSQGHASPFMDQIDEVCDDFEAAWQRGSRIRIENCLRLVPDEAREELLRELLEIEIALRIQSGESVLFENYATRFPDHTDIVKAVLMRHTGRRRLGDYELLEQLGRGGMGVVYKARQVYLNQIVAIKILPEQYMGDAHALSRFRREMQLIGGLNHPNIVQAYNAGEAEGMHYLVMEYVAGVTLQRLIADTINKRYDGSEHDSPKKGYEFGEVTLPHFSPDDIAPTEIDPESEVGSKEQASENGDQKDNDIPVQVKAMSIGAACETIRQAALGLHHAHQRGLVHRDIKPGNLMLDVHGLIKVLDLGLGKFQADVRQNDRTMGPLTQAGTTMGTVDYMAPEQWDDPTTVDIRADIYSLGNTLFFLLCGNPPFDGKNYGSNREKLMAHIVAEPPSLRKRCPDVPPELEQVYLKMAAKEAVDRYQTPIEVVEALEPFADADALIECIPEELKNASDAEQSTSSQYANSVGRDTIASYPMTPSRRRRISELAPPPKPWYKRQEFFAFIALFNMMLLVIAITLVGKLWKAESAPPPENPMIGMPDIETLRYDPTVRNAIAADLVELPGLSGATWFSEMPWFTPFVRREAAHLLSQTTQPETVLGSNLRGYLDADTVNVQQWLWAITEKVMPKLNPAQQKLVVDLKALADSNLDGDDYAQNVEAALRNFVTANANQPFRAADANTEAMLMHLLSGLQGNKELAEKARQKYQEALNAYGEDVVSQQLKLLCTTDMARLIARTLGDYELGHKSYIEARNSPLATNLLKVEIYTALGMELAGIGQYEDRNFEIAKVLLTSPDRINIGQNHPLVAHVQERHAWSLVDQWKVNEAQQLFGQALSIREANSREGKNPFADIYMLHNRHGLAMTTRFRGDPADARKQFEPLVADIEKKLAEAELTSQASPDKLLPGQLRYFRELRERLANSRYRLADCELFGGAASGVSGINLVGAEQLYDQARMMTNDRSTRVLLTVKLSLIRAMLGKFEEANINLDELNPEIERILSVDGRFRARQAISLMQQVVKVRAAEAIVDPKTPTPESLESYGREVDAFRKLLHKLTADQLTGTPKKYNRNRPDSLEFRLFCSEFLLDAERKYSRYSGQPTLSKQEDLLYMLGTMNAFDGNRETIPYARRYYDFVIQLADDSTNAAQIAFLIIFMQGPPIDFQPGNDLGAAWSLLFHFSATDNFAILMKNDDETPPTLCRLNLTREAVREAGNLGQEIEPQPELAEIFKQVKQARESGRIVNIYWNDSACWTYEKDALVDKDWPFKSALPLRMATTPEPVETVPQREP